VKDVTGTRRRRIAPKRIRINLRRDLLVQTLPLETKRGFLAYL
jgi:hypothetical protein